MVKNPGDGIYKSRCLHGPATFFPHRNIYIQGSTVRLVSDTRVSTHLFSFSDWFQVNILGERIGDLPENFNIRFGE